MEALSEPFPWCARPDLACNAMPHPFLIQAPLPDVVFFYAAACYLPDSEAHLLGSTVNKPTVS